MPNITIPIIDALIHPPFGVLSRSAAAGNPQAGGFLAVAPPSFGLFPAYGCVLKIHSVGAFHGRDVSFPVEYDPPLGKLGVHYTDLSGFDIVQQLGFWTFDAQPVLWETPLPALFTLYTAPDVTVDLFWLHT
jgi:hypothetical protein